jgi:hypothetical protein
VDNVKGVFDPPELSSMITQKYITGMAPYGHGEESRPNNLTYCITSNSCRLGTDLAHRCLYVYVAMPTDEQRNGWRVRVSDYIEKNRLRIVSDIIHMLSTHKEYPMPKLPIKGTIRFAEFASRVLAPCCGSEKDFADVLVHSINVRAEANVEEEQAHALADQFQYQIEALGLDANSPVYITTAVCNSWARKALQESHDIPKTTEPIQLVRNLAKAGMLPKMDAEIRRWPASRNKERHSGIAWNFTDSTETAYLVYRDGEGKFQTKALSI